MKKNLLFALMTSFFSSFQRVFVFSFFLLLVLLAGCTAVPSEEPVITAPLAGKETSRLGQPVSKPVIDHLHGMALSADSEVLTLATHHGLFHWSEGQWHESAEPKHDHMGFSASVADGEGGESAYYTSGHPAPGSGLTNPLGLMRSMDFGKTWETLSLEGEADFHLMASSTGVLTIYGWTQVPNSQMPEKGLYFTKNGITWERSAMNGLNADPLVLMVHPVRGGTILASTVLGTFISEDYGQNFTLLTEIFFTAGDFKKDGGMTGSDVLVGATLDIERNTSLVAFDIKTGEVEELTLPNLQAAEKATYLTVSAADLDTIFLATPLRNAFMSRDGGMSWEQILKQ